jgi:cell division septum initiation protein DivIVA
MREITPSDLRNVHLKRRLRGYDREKTEELLAEAAQSYERVETQRGALSEEIAKQRRDQEEREARFRAELDSFRERLSARDRRIVELEAEIARYEQELSGRVSELSSLREELAGTREAQGKDQKELLELRQRVARLETREKALGEQVAMLATQLEQEDATPLPPPRASALPQRVGHAASMLVRFDHAVEMLERETRREAELTLKKARERAHEIVQSAEAHRRRLEGGSEHSPTSNEPRDEVYDPVSALQRIERPAKAQDAPDPLESRIGEASWTSRAAYGRAPADRDSVH